MQVMDFKKTPKISKIMLIPKDDYPTKLLNPAFRKQNLNFEFRGGTGDER